ncbi:chain-length determining protein [Geomonas limicola]|uniref:Chain-length determining protein n=1 Tax=Geomonas limicola TaxID=2740186 RepID=A0A6V8N247_9BACT|nr:XrtA system polysaccharide chain length determinant [Geomonas limicola]GFO66568.1 chain-length determining protein [Geomonas limicola]
MQPTSSEFQYRKYLQLLTRRKELFVVLALVITTAFFVASFLLPRKYESTSTVFIEKNVISELVKGITVTPSMEDTINVLTYAITSRTLLTKVVDSLDMNISGKSDLDQETLIKELQKNTKVKVKDKNLFTISFTHKNPRVARDFVNTLVRVYIEQSISSKRGESYDATKFLTEQIDTFNQKLKKAEDEVNTYKRDKGGIIAIDEGKLFEEINIAQQKLYDLELRRRQLEGMRQVTQKTNDPLLARLTTLEKRRDELLMQYNESYPDVIKVNSDIETVKQQLADRKGGQSQPLEPQELARIEAEIGAIKVTEAGLKRYINTNKTLLQNIPTAKAGLDKLELEKKNQKNIYDQLFARQGQSEVSKQMEVQDKSTTFRVVDPAVLPLKPSSPNRLRIMFIGLVGGLVGSFGLLVLLDQLDSTAKDVDFVKGLGHPVLAIIPRLQDQEMLARQRRRSLRIFVAAGCYLLLLLVFPAMEIFDLRVMDRLLDSMHSPDLATGLKGLLR